MINYAPPICTSTYQYFELEGLVVHVERVILRVMDLDRRFPGNVLVISYSWHRLAVIWPGMLFQVLSAIKLDDPAAAFRRDGYATPLVPSYHVLTVLSVH